jgi:hypothetical protein
MQNVTMTVQDNVLIISVRLDAETTPSKSGKTEVLASTGGFAKAPVPGVIVGLNVCRK